jgi:ribosomal-protein-alanine N-acetyltransferase
MGIELAPERWGRFALALDVTTALLEHGFDTLGLKTVRGSTASGNARVAKLASWFGASIVAERDDPAWMGARGWREVDWAVDRNTWRNVRRRNRRVRTEV